LRKRAYQVLDGDNSQWNPQPASANDGLLFGEGIMKRHSVFLGSVIAMVFSLTVNAQCGDSVVGTWKLISNTTTTEKGEVNEAAFGQNPSGLLTYTADGRMMAIISDDGRKPLSIADRVAAPAEERAQAYSTFMAYAGRYAFSCDKVVHHIEVASLQNWVNTDQTRLVSLRGNRLFLRNTPQLRGGVVVTIESVWERLK
jgi:hypothetical protein